MLALEHKRTYWGNSRLELALEHKINRVLCIPMRSWEYSMVSNHSVRTGHRGVTLNRCSKKRKHCVN